MRLLSHEAKAICHFMTGITPTRNKNKILQPLSKLRSEWCYNQCSEISFCFQTHCIFRDFERITNAQQHTKQLRTGYARFWLFIHPHSVFSLMTLGTTLETSPDVRYVSMTTVGRKEEKDLTTRSWKEPTK